MISDSFLKLKTLVPTTREFPRDIIDHQAYHIVSVGYREI